VNPECVLAHAAIITVIVAAARSGTGFAPCFSEAKCTGAIVTFVKL